MKKIILSPSFRLGMQLSILAALLMALLFLIFGAILRHRDFNLIVENAKIHQKNVSLQVNCMVRSVEVAIENRVWYVRRSGKDLKALAEIPRQILDANAMILGSAIAFKQHYISPTDPYFMVYSHRGKNGEIKHKRLGSQAYDYFYMDWFQIPRLLKSSYWSEPFYDMGGADELMVTYSRPLYDAQGEFYGVLTANISLNWLKKMIQESRTHTRSYTFMLSRNGYYLVHPVEERVMNETIFSANIDVPDAKSRIIGEKMIAGITDFGTFKKHETLSYIVFSSVPRTGWSLGTVWSEPAFYEDFRGSLWNLIWLGLLAIIVQTGVIALVIRSLRKRKKWGALPNDTF